MAVFRELRDVNVIFFGFLTQKKHILARFDVLRVKIGSEPLEEPGQKRSRVNIFDAQFCAYGEKKPLEGS